MIRKYTSLLFLLLGVVALLPSAGFAQTAPSLVKTAYNRIEDQVNAKTFLVVRADLTTIDSATFTATLDAVFTNLVKERKFSDDKIKSARREFHGALDKINQNLKTFEELRSVLGIREVFVVLQNQSDKSVRIIVPGAQKDIQAQLEEAAPFAAPLKPIKVANGVAFATNAEEDAAIYKNFKASENSQLKRFYQNDATGTIQVFCSSFDLEKFYQTLDERLTKSTSAKELSAEAKASVDAFKSYFQQVNLSIDLNKLTIKGAFVFTTAERAETARKGLESLVDQLINDGYESKAYVFKFSRETTEKYNLKAVDRELERASFRAALPKRSDNSLVFEFTPDSKNVWSNTCVLPLL